MASDTARSTRFRQVGRTVAWLLALGFAAIIAAAVTAVWLQMRNQELTRQVEHTLVVEAQIGQLAFLNERTETARRGYILSGDPDFRTYFEEERAALRETVRNLLDQTRDNDEQQRRLRSVQMQLEQVYAGQLESMRRADAGEREAVGGQLANDPVVAMVRSVRQAASEMREAEAALLSERNQAQFAGLQAFYAVLLAAGFLIVLVAIATMTVVLRYTRDLARSQEALEDLNAGLEQAVAERTEDLSRANEEIQRFAYIVSHDLRSPLVNVMGFTSEMDAARAPLVELIEKVEEAHPELVSPAARTAVMEELPEAIGFIRTSTQKMDRLINAILKLSREGRRTLAPEPVDAGALVQGIVDALHQRIADAEAEVTVVEPLPDLVTDRLALDQILSNLVENAIKYLQPGRPGQIRISGRRERGRILFEVADNGRGIDPRDHARIFDLFRRSGAQDRPGEGIGLAHVRALAYRLGGIITVKSELDRGATFILSLPAAVVGEESAP